MSIAKTYFCTFSDSRLQPTLQRIETEAKSSGFFDEIFVFNEFNLNKDFKKKFKAILKYTVRGYGYWIWKVSIIQDALARLNDGDILLYTDSGCSINKNGFSKFYEYVKLVEDSKLGILAVALESDFVESKYTKGDLFDYFEVRENKAIYSTPQIQANVILIKKNKNADIFFKQWKKVYEDDISLVNDEPSKKVSFPDFITHRHDQSVFSILFKIHNGITIPLNEVWVKNEQDLKSLKHNPIWAIREKNRKIKGLKCLCINWMKDFMGLTKQF